MANSVPSSSRLNPLLLQQGAPWFRILRRVVREEWGDEPGPPVDLDDHQQELAARLEDPRDFGDRLRALGSPQMVDRVGADHGVEFAVAERQLAHVADAGRGALGDAGNSRVPHEPFGRVLVDAPVAAVDVHARRRGARPGEQHADRRAPRSRADVEHASRCGCQEPLGREPHGAVEHRVEEHDGRCGPHGHEDHRDSHPARPGPPHRKRCEAAGEDERREHRVTDRQAVPEVVVQEVGHAHTIGIAS